MLVAAELCIKSIYTITANNWNISKYLVHHYWAQKTMAKSNENIKSHYWSIYNLRNCLITSLFSSMTYFIFQWNFCCSPDELKQQTNHFLLLRERLGPQRAAGTLHVPHVSQDSITQKQQLLYCGVSLSSLFYMHMNHTICSNWPFPWAIYC